MNSRGQPDTNRLGGLQTLTEGLGIALDAIRANKIRSSLTILGVSVGVAVVVLVAALITGIRTSVMSSFESAGPNNFFVTRFDFTSVRLVDDGSGRPPWWDKPELTTREAEVLGRLEAVDHALFNFDFSANFQFENERVSGVSTSGYSSGWPAYTDGLFVAGRDFTPAEVRQNRALVVISVGLAEDLFGQRDPIGRIVKIGSPFRGTQESFRVVGVFELTENIFSPLADHFAIVPHTAASRRLRMSDWQANILIVPHDSVSMEEAQDQVIAALRGARGLGPREENNFALLASAQLLDMFNRLTAVFFLVMLALSSAGLLVGGVGVIGIMLISVTERTREIGIRKAVGATRREILWQFLVEASVLTFLGAGIGMMGGWGLSEIVASITPIPSRIPLWAVFAALSMAVLTGMLFGLLPAYRGSRMDPVEALRFE
ncbi:MAG: ABC transporter permease [Gemmatimonadota bacterium]|nr:ABC transporter permease [Gemmatimonadota bacterium]MDH5760899.1 ABC transporter permease [Gemmatimonadota bacterium]